MTGKLIHREPADHFCNPGWTFEDGHFREWIGNKPGDVWQCECGITWVAYSEYLYDKGSCTGYIIAKHRVKWKMESKRHRRKRERRASK